MKRSHLSPMHHIPSGVWVELRLHGHITLFSSTRNAALLNGAFMVGLPRISEIKRGLLQRGLFKNVHSLEILES